MSKLGYDRSIISDTGKPIPATIAVLVQGTSTPATIYTTPAGAVQKANPFTTDDLGRFQFFADGGTYDLEVYGPGITTYKIECISLALTGPAGPEAGIHPEDYGAYGDGSHDDWEAFNNMFAALAPGGSYSGTARRKIILNPAVYYSIQGRKNATNVFELAIPYFLMEGPGMGVVTFRYDSIQPATNFFYIPNDCCWAKLSEFQAICGVGDSPDTRDLSPIVNILAWDNTIYTSIERLELTGCTGACVTGFNWMSEVRHCNFKWAGIGHNGIATTAWVVNNYANVCLIGYNIGGYYGHYAGNASDSANVSYFLDSPTSVELIGNGSEGSKQAIKGGATSVSIQGMSGNSWVPYTEGDPVAWIELDNCQGRLMGIADRAEFYMPYILQTKNCGKLILDGLIPHSRHLIVDTNADQYNEPASIGNDWTGNLYETFALASVEALINSTLHNYNGCQNVLAIVQDGTVNYATSLKLKNMKGFGRFTMQRGSTTGAAILNFNQATGNGLEIENTHIPIFIDGNDSPDTMYFDFHQGGSGALFKLTNCQQLTLLNLRLSAMTGSGYVFLLDEFSNVTLDKYTMDNMSPLFAGLCTHASWRREAAVRRQIKFTGYSDKPTAGVFDTGCRIDFDAPTAGGYPGCVCTAGGNPGTWKYLAAVEA